MKDKKAIIKFKEISSVPNPNSCNDKLMQSKFSNDRVKTKYKIEKERIKIPHFEGSGGVGVGNRLLKETCKTFLFP